MANQFKVGDKVRTLPTGATGVKLNGNVKHIACGLATTKGGKTCDKKNCAHMLKEYVWVLWPMGTTTFSYHYTELEFDAAQPATGPAPILPSAATMAGEAQTTGNKEKDDYLSKAKQAIKDVIKPQPAKPALDFFRVYNGFSQIKYDRAGRPFVREMEAKPQPVINDNEIDWDAYTGRTKGPVKKSKVKTPEE